MSTTTDDGTAAPPRSRFRRARQRPTPNPTGRMTLGGHLRELRSRLVKSGFAILVGSVVGWIYYDAIFDMLRRPIDDVVAQAVSGGADVKLVLTGVAQAFTLQLQVAATVGLIIASPVWIYQLWRFITPGLKPRERRWGYVFVGAAVPLFLAGVLVAYLTLPNALGLLFSFTPPEVANYVPVDAYLSFFLRMVLVFGVGFLVPLILVALNAVGVLTGRRLARSWRIIVFSVLVFAAIGTPTGDPINMCVLAVPILVLVGAALAVCFLNDRRRAARGTASSFDQWADDETSPI